MEVMEQCSKYNKCNAPLCPLDPDMRKRVYYAGEPVCTMEKQVRVRLGKNLPNKGLLPKELAGVRNWQRRTDKSVVLERLSRSAFKKGKGSFVSVVQISGVEDRKVPTLTKGGVYV